LLKSRNLININPKNIQKLKYKDTLGEFTSHEGGIIEIDVYSKNKEHTFMEIKYKPSIDDVIAFDSKVLFLSRKLNITKFKKLLIGVEIQDNVKKYAEKSKMDVIAGYVVPSPK
jgi:uridine kinase